MHVWTNLTNLHLSNNRDGSSQLLVDHESEDAHHGSTALVQFNRPLLCLPLLALLVPAKVEAVSEVTLEFRLSRNISHNADLQEGDERQDLKKSSGGDGVRSVDSGKSIRERIERVSGAVNISREVVSSTRNKVADEGKLRNTSVLQLDVSQTVESLLVGSVEEAKRVPEAKRSLCTELRLELHCHRIVSFLFQLPEMVIVRPIAPES